MMCITVAPVWGRDSSCSQYYVISLYLRVFFFNDSVNELVLLGRDIERDESKGIECLQSNLHCRLDLFSDAQGFAEDVVEEVATIPKRKTSKRLLRRKKPTLDDLRREMRMVSPR